MLRYGLILAAVVFVADQIVKYWILVPMGFAPEGWWSNPSGFNECLEGYRSACRHIEIGPVFDLTMVWNKGVSFGLLRAETDIVRWGLVLLSFVISGIFVMWLRTAERRVTATALGLVIGGALGNVIDRIRFGAVADFLDFSMDGRFFPWVFNVADAGITVGAILLAVDMIFLSETEPGKGTSWSQLKARFSGGAAKSDAPPPAEGG